MRPVISATSFGSITIDGMKYSHDVYITADGTIKKRKKKLSKRKYGTSHMISKDEIELILSGQARFMLIGTGQYDRVRLSDPAIRLLAMRKIQVELHPTPQAIETWNNNDQITLGLFHVTC